MRTSYFSDEAVRIAGRPYRLFLAHMPDDSRWPAVASQTLGICVIYDEVSGGKHVKYQTFRVLLSDLQRPNGIVRGLVDGVPVRLKASADVSFLDISR